MGMTDLALRADLSATVRDYLQTAKAAADGLMQLLTQLLDFSRLAANTLPLEASPFTCGRCWTRRSRPWGVQASEKGLELVRDLPEDLPNRLVGDPLRLRQILTNLVSNASSLRPRAQSWSA